MEIVGFFRLFSALFFFKNKTLILFEIIGVILQLQFFTQNKILTDKIFKMESVVVVDGENEENSSQESLEAVISVDSISQR